MATAHRASVRDSGEVLFIEPWTAKTRAEAIAYTKGWFDRAFQRFDDLDRPVQWAIAVGQHDDLDPDIDKDLIRELDSRPEGTWVAFGIGYRFPPDPLLNADERDDPA